MDRNLWLAVSLSAGVYLVWYGYFDKRVKVSRVSKRYFRFIATGQPASRSMKAAKR